jgi:hypothetical protein
MFAALLVFAFTVPAGAVEHQLGGYWRTRFFMQNDFHGYDASLKGSGQDTSRIDTRTRLYYTAVINDNLKLVSKFEMDAVWGQLDSTFNDGSGHGLQNSWGDVGADGIAIEIKNMYAEFNLGGIWRVGVQQMLAARGFMTDDDVPGVLYMHPWGDHLIGAFWVRIYEGGIGENVASDEDIDFPGVFGVFKLMDGMTINPWFAYGYSDKGGNDWQMSSPVILPNTDGSVNAYWIGADWDWNTDMYGLWFTGIYMGGSMDKGYTGTLAAPVLNNGTEWDLSAYLVAIGGHWNLGAGDIHAQFFYASGDDNANDNDWEQFDVFDGRSYYWAEIMGLGLFDNQVSANAPGDVISNIYAANLGVTWTFAEKHKITADIWYASLLEKSVPYLANIYPSENLGTEIDLRYTYPIVEGLNLDIVGAYLFAGDGTYKQAAGGPSDANPYELGMQLSLSF